MMANENNKSAITTAHLQRYETFQGECINSTMRVAGLGQTIDHRQ